MAIDLQKLKKGTRKTPPRILIYGEPGIGKTTFAVGSNKAILANIETSGADRIDCTRLFSKEIDSYSELEDALEALAIQEHNYKWLAIDSIDWLESIFFNDVCKENNVDRIDALDYGKGYQLVIEKWESFRSALEYLQTEKGMGIIFVAHSEVITHRDPLTDPYDRYELRLNKNSKKFVIDWIELIGFAHKKVLTKQEDKGFGQKGGKAVGDAVRVFSIKPANAGFLSKTRLELPEEMPLDWVTFEKHLNEAMK